MGMTSDFQDMCVALRNAVATANEKSCGSFDYLIGEGINARLEQLDLEPLELCGEYYFIVNRKAFEDSIEILDNDENYKFTLTEADYNPESDLLSDSDDVIAYWLQHEGQHILSLYGLGNADLDRGY